MERLGDRRAGSRFELVEPLFGTLDVMQSAHLIDVSRTGALVVLTNPVAVGSLQSFYFMVHGNRVPVSVVVRRVVRTESNGGLQFHVGVDFTSTAEPLIEAIVLAAGTHVA